MTAADPPLKLLGAWHDDDSARAVAFTPDESALTVGGSTIVGGKGEIRSFTISRNSATGEVSLKRGGLAINTPGALQNVVTLAYAPDGKTLAVGNMYRVDRTTGVQLWDVATGKLRSVALARRDDPSYHIATVAYSPDGKYLAAGEWGSHWASGLDHVRILDATRPDLMRGAFLASTPQVTGLSKTPGNLPTVAVAFSPDSTLLVGLSRYEGQLWDVAKGRPRSQLTARQFHQFTAAAFSRDSKLVAVAEKPSGNPKVVAGMKPPPQKSTVTVWDLSKPKPTSVAVFDTDAESVAFVSETTLVTPGADGLQVWDLTTMKSETLKGSPKGAGVILVLSPSGKYLAAVAAEATHKGGILYAVSPQTSRK